MENKASFRATRQVFSENPVQDSRAKPRVATTVRQGEDAYFRGEVNKASRPGLAWPVVNLPTWMVFRSSMFGKPSLAPGNPAGLLRKPRSGQPGKAPGCDYCKAG
ncbi:MAG: hypothetical protein IPH20_25665 [Bacteroidales bacterium]|nr:hypothetical protein [Bacteroidales bacterium]